MGVLDVTQVLKGTFEWTVLSHCHLKDSVVDAGGSGRQRSSRCAGGMAEAEHERTLLTQAAGGGQAHRAAYGPT